MASDPVPRSGAEPPTSDPEIHPDGPNYRRVYATEAQTPARAVRKVRPLAGGRRLRPYLATGQYKHELANAAWVG